MPYFCSARTRTRAWVPVKVEGPDDAGQERRPRLRGAPDVVFARYLRAAVEVPLNQDVPAGRRARRILRIELVEETGTLLEDHHVVVRVRRRHVLVDDPGRDGRRHAPLRIEEEASVGLKAERRRGLYGHLRLSARHEVVVLAAWELGGDARCKARQARDVR